MKFSTGARLMKYHAAKKERRGSFRTMGKRRRKVRIHAREERIKGKPQSGFRLYRMREEKQRSPETQDLFSRVLEEETINQNPARKV